MTALVSLLCGIAAEVTRPELAWMDLARCNETDPEAFFPERGSSTREAKFVCGRCEVRGECLDYSLEHDERFGVWGGKSERQRQRLRARRDAARGRDAA